MVECNSIFMVALAVGRVKLEFHRNYPYLLRVSSKKNQPTLKDETMTTTPEQQPSSRLARLSLILGILGWMVWCVYFVVFGIVIGGGMNFGSQLDTESMGYLVALGGPLITSLFTIVLTVAALVVGIQALRKKDPRRGMAITGIILSLVCLLPYLLFFILLLVSGLFKSGS